LDFGHRRIDTRDSDDDPDSDVHDVNNVKDESPTRAVTNESNGEGSNVDDSTADGVATPIEMKEEMSESEKERLAEVEMDLEKYRLAEAEVKREAEEEAETKRQAIEIALSDMDALLSDQDGQVDKDQGREQVEKLEHEQELRILESIIKQEQRQQEEALQRLGMYMCIYILYIYTYIYMYIYIYIYIYM
jgi:hypothetical protein